MSTDPATANPPTTPPQPHLVEERHHPGRNGDFLYGTDGEREWYCRRCGKRVTVSPDGQREYGHARDCAHHSMWEAGA